MATDSFRTISSESTTRRREKTPAELSFEQFLTRDYDNSVEAKFKLETEKQKGGFCSSWNCFSGVRCCTRKVIILVNEPASDHEVLAARKVASRSLSHREEQFPKISASFFHYLARRYGSSLSYIFHVAVKYLPDPDKSYWSQWMVDPFEHTEPLIETQVTELIDVLDTTQRLFKEIREKKMREDILRIIYSSSPDVSPEGAPAEAALDDMLAGSMSRLSVSTTSRRAIRRKSSTSGSDDGSLCNFIDEDGHGVKPYELDPIIEDDERMRILESRPLNFKVMLSATYSEDFDLDKLALDIFSTFDCKEGEAKKIAEEVRDQVRYEHLSDKDTIGSQTIYDTLTDIAIQRGLEVRKGSVDPVLDNCIKTQLRSGEEILDAEKVDDISHQAFADLLREYQERSKRKRWGRRGGNVHSFDRLSK